MKKFILYTFLFSISLSKAFAQDDLMKMLEDETKNDKKKKYDFSKKHHLKTE